MNVRVIELPLDFGAIAHFAEAEQKPRKAIVAESAEITGGTVLNGDRCAETKGCPR
jgi:hypothetical protein